MSDKKTVIFVIVLSIILISITLIIFLPRDKIKELEKIDKTNITELDLIYRVLEGRNETIDLLIEYVHVSTKIIDETEERLEDLEVRYAEIQDRMDRLQLKSD